MSHRDDGPPPGQTDRRRSGGSRTGSRDSDDPAKLYGTDATAADRVAALVGGEVPVAVYGLGKMGLPLAAVYADVTGNVVGVDVDESVVRSVNRGESHVAREPGLDDLVAGTVERGALRATADPPAAAREAAVHVVIVPTLLDDDGSPDLSALESVVEDVAWGLDPGDAVLVESTVPPRTCRDAVEPTLVERSGLDRDAFGVAFCPERTASGRALRDIRGAYPKVVGGTDDEATRVAALVYEQLTDNEVVPVTDATTAEAVKVFEGVYRDVNIALANQLALLADDLSIDVREAKDVANTQPYCDVHDPGPGVGGHCIPVYPHFLLAPFGDAGLLRVAREVNDAMPAHAVDLVRRGLAAEGRAVKGATVLVLGATYRPGVAELRNAPALSVVRDLDDRGADVLAVDPVVDDPAAVAPAEPVPIDEAYDADPDAVVLVTAHEEFTALDPDGFGGAVVVDSRGVFDPDLADAPVYVLGDGRNPPDADRSDGSTGPPPGGGPSADDGAVPPTRRPERRPDGGG